VSSCGYPARHLRQHPNNVALDGADVCLDLLDGPGRSVTVEIGVEVDLVADKADPAVLGVTLAGVDPGVRYMGPDLAFEEGADAG
jgi:hypothetical protein